MAEKIRIGAMEDDLNPLINGRGSVYDPRISLASVPAVIAKPVTKFTDTETYFFYQPAALTEKFGAGAEVDKDKKIK